MYTSVCVTLKKNIASTLSLLTLDAEVGYVADIGHVKDVGHVALLREAPVSKTLWKESERGPIAFE